MLREKEGSMRCPTLSHYPLLPHCLLPVATSARSFFVGPDRPLKQVQEREKGKLCSQQTQAPAFVGLPRIKRDQESGGHWRTESYFSVQE